MLIKINYAELKPFEFDEKISSISAKKCTGFCNLIICVGIKDIAQLPEPKIFPLFFVGNILCDVHQKPNNDRRKDHGYCQKSGEAYREKKCQ